MIRFVLVMAIVVAGMSVAQAAEPVLRKGQSFYSARAAVLRDGWQPVEIFEQDPDGGNALHSWGDAKPFYRSGLKEVESCTGVDADYCDFNYRRKDRCLFLVTAGEYGAPGARYVPTVASWWTYPQSSKVGCSANAADKVPSDNKFNRHSFP